MLGIALAVLAPVSAGARPDPAILAAEILRQESSRPDGIHVLDGSCVLDRGQLHVNITNHGLIGSQYTQVFPYSSAPSGQWPGGTGHEYLWGAGLWIGGSINGELSVTTGQPERELRPGEDLRETIYESREDRQVRPTDDPRTTGRRAPASGADDDGDGRKDEEFLDGRDNDGDGSVDEDYGQIGDQMYTCIMRDDGPLVRELYPDHNPLGVSVLQRAAVFANEDDDDYVMLDFTITNTGIGTVKDVYLGTYVDCDIQRRGDGASEPDDLAGFFDGALRGQDGSFHRMKIGWMRDADPVDPLPGVFGAMMMGHDTDPLAHYAPNVEGVRSFNIFATSALTIQDGEPLSDEDRYALMSGREIDRDRRDSQPGDLKFVFSSGPFGNLPPGRTISYRVALVVGVGMDGMLRNALRASEVHRGAWLDLDNNMFTGGGGGRERLVCLGDYPAYTNGEDPIFDYRAAFMDEHCVTSDPIFGVPIISPDDLFTTADGKRCVYVNGDNCEECFRSHGAECTLENDLANVATGRYFGTGTAGGETHVPWLASVMVPPNPPRLRVVPRDNGAELFWDDRSEFELDPAYGLIDFESYQVWRVANWIRPEGTTEATGPAAALWSLEGEWDVVNRMPAAGGRGEISLGRNTGLDEIRYRPACLDDPRYTGLAAVMQDLVDADVEGAWLVRPPVRAADGAVIPGMEPLVPWESEPAVLDTFFAVTARAGAPAPNRVVAKRATGYYRYRDDSVHNGFRTFYAVVAADHALGWDGARYIPVGPGIAADPGNNRVAVTPGPPAQTAAERERMGTNIYVYPNPVTRTALDEFQRQPATEESPTGVRLLFNNLPAARNRITIYTASGDLVATVPHDGTNGVGAAPWDLMSRNGQEVVSGIYFYVVESDDARFAPHRGRFVVIR